MRSDNYGDIFWKGYDRGHAAVSQFDEARRKGLARKGMRELDSATTADPNAAQADAYARENAATAAQDNATFGTAATQEDYQYSKPQLTEARGLGDAERYRRAETIYRGQGFDDQAEKYGDRSRVATRQEKEDVRTARRDALSEKATGLQIRKGERDESKDIKLEAFNVDFATYQADVADKKKPFNIGELYTMAQKHGVPVDEVNKLALNQLGVDEKVATARVQDKLRELGEAAEKGLPAMLALADPDPNDNILPSEVKNKDGTTSIMYGGKELYKLPPAAPGISVSGMLFQEIKGTLEGNPIAAGIQFLAIDKAKLDMKNVESQIGLRTVQGKAAMISANASATKAANAGAGGSEKLTALTGYANSLNTEVANLDRAMVNNGDPKSPEYKGFVAQRERALGSLQQIRQQIEGERFGMGGAQQGNPNMDDGTQAKYMTRAAQAVQSGKMTVEAANAELRARGVPELDPADFSGKPTGIGPKKGSANRLPTYPELREEQARKKREEDRKRSGYVPGYTPADPYAGMY